VDVLSGVSLDWLKYLTWISAVGTAVLLLFLRPRRPDLAALRAAVVLMATNAGAGIYVLNHVGDPRWARPAEERLSAPPLRDAPVVGQFMEPFDSFIGGVVKNVNDLMDFQAALPVAMEFFVAAGWAWAVSLPLGVVTLVVGYFVAKRRKAEFVRYKAEVGTLKQELEEIKRHLGYPDSTPQQSLSPRSAPASAQ
jgi:hypothetical protein